MKSRVASLVVLMSVVFLFTSCVKAPPPTLDLPQEKPEQKSTEYSKALEKFGDLLNIYSYSVDPKSQYVLYVTSRPFVDKTGVHSLSQGEIPQEMTDMVKSALNRIGPNIRYVIGDYSYTVGTEQLYKGVLKRKAPAIVFDGGLTEFDRGLTGSGGDFGVSASVGTGTFAADIEASNSETTTMSRITIDLNLIDFRSQLLIPKMQATNTIKVHKGLSKYDVGFAIFGTGLGGGGSAKELQGRHAALRLLIDFSVLELLGRYHLLPYWRCVEGGKVDDYVMQKKKMQFLRSSQLHKIEDLQYYLMYHGYFRVRPTGMLDDSTRAALNDFMRKNNFVTDNYLDPDLYLKIFESVPLDIATVHKAETLYQQYVSKALARAKVAQQRAEQAKSSPAKQENVQKVSRDKFNETNYLSFMREAKKAFKISDYQKAQKYIEAVLKGGVPRGEAEPYLYGAYIEQGLNNIEVASRYLQVGLKTAPNNIQLYKAYVRLLVSQNKLEEARNVLNRGLAVFPGNLELESLKTYLSSAR